MTIMTAPLLTCSARLPVYALLIGGFIPERQFGLVSVRCSWPGWRRRLAWRIGKAKGFGHGCGTVCGACAHRPALVCDPGPRWPEPDAHQPMRANFVSRADPGSSPDVRVITIAAFCES